MSSNQQSLSDEEMKKEIARLEKENKHFEKVLFSYPKDAWKNTVNVIAKDLNLTKAEIDLLLESDDEK